MAIKTEYRSGKTRFGLGGKLFLAFSAAALVPIVIALISAITIYVRNIDGIAKELVREKNRSAGLLLSERFDRMSAFLEYISGENALTVNLDLELHEAVSGYLAGLLATGDVDALWVVTAGGVTINPSASARFAPRSSPGEPSGDPGRAWLAESDGHYFIVASLPLTGFNDRALGELYGAMDIKTVVAKISTELSAPVYLTDPQGALLAYDTHTTGDALPHEGDDRRLRQAVAVTSAGDVFHCSIAGNGYLFGVNAISVDGNIPLAKVGAGYLNSSIADVSEGGLFALVVSGLAMLLLSGGVSFYFTNDISGTAGKIAMTAGEIAHGKYGLETKIVRNDELGDLAAEFDHMSRILEHQESSRLRAQAELVESEIQFRSIFNGVSEAIFVHDIDTARIIDVNEAALVMYGYSRDEMLAGDIQNLSAVELGFDQTAAKSLVEQARNGQPVRSEWLARNKNGDDFWIEVSIQKAQIGGEDRILVSAIDIGERKRMENAILQANSRLEATVQERTLDLRNSNRELTATLADLERAQNKLVETEKLSVLGYLSAGIAHELNTPLGAIISSLGSFEYFIKNRFDALSDFRAGLSEREREDCGSILADILPRLSRSPRFESGHHRRKEIRSRLEDSGIPDAVEKADRIVDWDIEVEIEALLPFMGGERAVKLLEYCGEILSLHRIVGITALSTQKAVVVVNALRSYLHPESQAENGAIDVDAELDTILILMRNKMKHSVEIRREYGGAKAWGSAEKLGQVLINLINNALEAMQYKGVLTLRTSNEGSETVINVIDDGPGIPEAIQEKIFEPFFSTKPPGEGLGLGLDICRKITNSLGGKIQLKSCAGETCFTVRVPRDGMHETVSSAG